MAIVPLHKVPNRLEAQKIIKELAAKGAYAWSKHCKERMKERGITISQIMNCLTKGRVTEDPFLVFENGGGYETRIEKGSAGDWLRVVVCMQFNQMLLMITAIN